MHRRQAEEIARRRTFAIISHPDAGKTTLTEKMLLFGGAIQLAGSIKARHTARHATSDWMAIERERGISVTTSVMNFCFRDTDLNLLDTPGHADFSEDTYRVLTAVDSALMVIDSAKGVEQRTRKLMEVCRLRNIPVITFVNKLDRMGLAPLAVLQDIEDTLQIECVPLTWPIGMGRDFRGVFDRRHGELRLFRPGTERRPDDVQIIGDPADARLDDALGEQAATLRQDLELLDGACAPFELAHYLRGSQTPVFFGSALNNFGVQEVLDAVVDLAPPPQPRATATRVVQPDEPAFTGFVFKIQANMDPGHRDRIAFVRICSGRFERGMKVRHLREQKDLIVKDATLFLARTRTNVEEAWPGDIIGIHTRGRLNIGDTLTEGEPLQFLGIPSFAPELFRLVVLRNPWRAKQLHLGLQQLAEEGAVQLFRPLHGGRDFILGALGPLQFEVTKARLRDEYDVEIDFQPLSYTAARWVYGTDKARLDKFIADHRDQLVRDLAGDLVYLAADSWLLERKIEQWPDLEFRSVRDQVALADGPLHAR